MRRIVVSEFVTLDGVMEDPGGAEGFKHGGWSFQFNRGPEGDKFKLDELMNSEALLLGRVTYQGFAQAWPSITDEVGFADRMNTMAKYVVSSTLRDADATWDNTTVLRGNLVEEMAELKAGPGGDLLVAGSCRLVHALIEHDLVDEYRLMVYPVLLGTGKRLYPESDHLARLSLASSETAGDGVSMLVYHAAGRAA